MVRLVWMFKTANRRIPALSAIILISSVLAFGAVPSFGPTDEQVAGYDGKNRDGAAVTQFGPVRQAKPLGTSNKPKHIPHQPFRSSSLLMANMLPNPGTPIEKKRGTYLDFIRVDQRPPLVGSGGAADSLFGPVDKSERGDGIAESHRAGLEELVKRFAPTLVLPKGDHTVVNGRKYQLLPSDPLLFADTLRLDMIRAAPYQFYDYTNIPFPTLTAESLAILTDLALRYVADPNLLAVWYFDFPGENPKEWWQAYGRLRTGPDSSRWSQPTVYAHPFIDPRGRVVIQYWYFYAINDFIGNHEGDTEHINVVLTPDRTAVSEVHYFFHARSINLPQGKYKPEIMDSTHPVVYAGGRAYMVVDYPIRIFAGDRNSGSHGSYPYPGEWEGAMGLGHPESVPKGDKDSTRIIRYHQFRVVLTPEPSRIDYHRAPEVLKEWAWLLLPLRWGYPSAPSVGAEIKLADVGNRAPFGPAFNAGWNRTAPGLTYPAFQVRKIPTLRSFVEDLLQPWYYLYIFRTPRYVHDTRGTLSHRDLERLGLAPRGGWAERGLGSSIFGVQLGYPTREFSDNYGNSVGISLWRNFWAKLRFGAIEFVGGYQKFRRKSSSQGSLFVYPITANLVLRPPDMLFRPYLTGGAGAYGWESRVRVSSDGSQLVKSGWDFGWASGLGVEYYLRPKVALDIGVRYHITPGPGSAGGVNSDQLRFVTVWMGHYVRF